jgi:hypothetical protein
LGQDNPLAPHDIDLIIAVFTHSSEKMLLIQRFLYVVLNAG